MYQIVTENLRKVNNCLITVTYILLSVFGAFVYAQNSYAESKVQSKSVLSLDASIYNQQSFEDQNYQVNNLTLSNQLLRKTDNTIYRHNLGLLLQNGSQLNAYDIKLTEVYYGFKNDHSYLVIGRKKQKLSQVDDEWSLGLASPLFNHDFLNPEKQGQLGIHHSIVRNNYFVKTFVSYLHLPHQGPKFKLENEKFSSLNPWFGLPPSQVRESSGLTDVRYSVTEPKVSDVIFQPSLNFQVGHKSKSNWWSLGYANQVNSEFHKAYRFSQETNPDHFFVQVEGFTKRHQLYMADIGKRIGNTKFWLSYLKDSPGSKYLKDRKWQETHLDEQDWLSGGVKMNHFLVPNLSVSVDYIKRFDNKNKKDTVLGFDELESILSRSYFERSESVKTQVKYRYKLSPKKQISFITRFEYSIADQGQLVTAKVNYKTNKLNIFAESAILSAKSSDKTSFFSKYKGNDYLRLGGSYAF